MRECSEISQNSSRPCACLGTLNGFRRWRRRRKCNWENADVRAALSPFKQQRLDLQCRGAHPPACHSHTHSALTFPANLSPSSLIFALSPASSSLSSKPHLHLLFARVKKRFLSPPGASHKQLSGPEAQNPAETRRARSPPCFCACLAYPLAGLCPLAFCYRRDCCRQRHHRRDYLFGPAA